MNLAVALDLLYRVLGKLAVRTHILQTLWNTMANCHAYHELDTIYFPFGTAILSFCVPVVA